MLTDDQGWGDLGVHGNANLETPHVDSLARGGALFERFYVQPVCSPTRAEFLTGRWHPRGGVRGVSTGRERLDLDERTVAEIFREAGYATAAFGKWHNGTQSPYHPNDRGFDDFYGFCSGHWGEYFDPELDNNGRPVRGKGYLPDDLTEHALGFIEANRDRPFFCYLPLNTPHSPMQVPDEHFEPFRGKELPLRATNPMAEDVEKTRAALAMCENIDRNVGRVLAKLDGLGIANDTIVVYFSDNGPNGPRWNGGMRGTKGSTDEGGVRSPLLIRWPRRIPPGTRISRVAGTIDLLPTLAELAGVPVPADRPLDGRTLVPLLTGGPAAEWPDRPLFSHWNGKVGVRTQDWRLDDRGRLYEMNADPGQTRDVAATHPEVAGRLRQAVDGWRTEVLAESKDDYRPFTVGYAALTPLPARDGVPHGGVTRCAAAPNCSYFTNWRTPADRITWDIDVGRAGRFEAVIHYTCPADDVGSTVELSCGDATATGRVTEPHDPPLRGREHDRVDRDSESYVKDFAPLSLGSIHLAAGRATLTLRALDVPGRQVMDLRRLTLRRVDETDDPLKP